MNPLRAIAALVRRALRIHTDQALSATIGYLPAVASLSVFLWLELVYDESASLRVIGWFVVVYGVIRVLAGVLVGPRWFERADGFEVYSTMLARAAVLGVPGQDVGDSRWCSVTERRALTRGEPPGEVWVV